MITMEPLLKVTTALKKANIDYAMGGSGLLYSLGLVDSVRDWDLTTEAHLANVLEALGHLHCEPAPCGDYPFASSYRLSIHAEEPQIDLFGSFTIQTEAGLCRLPSIPSSIWNGIAVGSPEVWFVAYSLMNRKEKAANLFTYLQTNGSNSKIIALLLNEPLPSSLRMTLEQLA
ncbi:hypothetical protein [Brevibacillus sp. SYSU BS000544]|uniref:hypothetical protein n=1 Tax=Brevibacillus sp. SYSU BS000544 TaxID=3416443 RepID=UPI003CE4A119